MDFDMHPKSRALFEVHIFMQGKGEKYAIIL